MKIGGQLGVEVTAMLGPGEYVPDSTEGIVDINDLPQPILMPYDANYDHSPCPRCGHLAYRHKFGQRTLHDMGGFASRSSG